MRSEPVFFGSLVAICFMFFGASPIAALVPCTTVSTIMVPLGFDCEVFVANLDDPTGIAVESTSNVLVTQSGSTVDGNRVRRFSSEGVPLAMSSLIVDPDGVAIDSLGQILVAGGSQVTIANSLNGGTDQVCRSGFDNLQGVAVDSQGRVVVLTFGGGISDIICNTSTTPCAGIGSTAISVAFDKDDLLFATRFGAGLGLYRVNQCGSATKIVTLAGARGIAAGPGGLFGGNLFVGDDNGANPDRIVQIGADNSVTDFATGFNIAAGLAFDGATALYVTELGNDRVIRIPEPGSPLSLASGIMLLAVLVRSSRALPSA